MNHPVISLFYQKYNFKIKQCKEIVLIIVIILYQIDRFEEIKADKLNIKIKSKKEVYDVLTCTGGIYLPLSQDAITSI